jgi:hypothetical protein
MKNWTNISSDVAELPDPKDARKIIARVFRFAASTVWNWRAIVNGKDQKGEAPTFEAAKQAAENALA